MSEIYLADRCLAHKLYDILSMTTHQAVHMRYAVLLAVHLRGAMGVLEHMLVYTISIAIYIPMDAVRMMAVHLRACKNRKRKNRSKHNVTQVTM